MVIECGSVPSGSTFERKVVLVNRLDREIKFTEIVASCGCLDAQLLAPKRALADNSVLQPGEELVLVSKLVVDRKPGLFSRTIEVRTSEGALLVCLNGSSEPPFILTSCTLEKAESECFTLECKSRSDMSLFGFSVSTSADDLEILSTSTSMTWFKRSAMMA